MAKKIQYLLFIVAVTQFFYWFAYAPFINAWPWTIPIHSGIHTGYLTFAEWFVVAVVVVSGFALFRIHYPFQLRTIWWGLLVGLPSCFVAFYGMRDLFPGIFKVPDFGPLFGVALISALETGICEELVFRGTILQLLEELFYGFKHPTFWSIFLSSLLFGASHLDFSNGGNWFFPSLNQAVGAFGAGILYAVLTVCTGSLLPSIFLHALNDYWPLVGEIIDPTPHLANLTFHAFDPATFFIQSASSVASILLAWLIFTVWRRRTASIREPVNGHPGTL